MKTQSRGWLRALAVAGVLCSNSLVAVPFSFMDGELTGALDTTVSYGAGIRVNEPRADRVGPFAGGSVPSGTGTGVLIDANSDDGNLNYKQWDLYTHAIKATSELEASYQDWSFFTRATALYDFQVNHVVPRRVPHGKSAINILGKDVKVLDLYLQKDTRIRDIDTSIRFGEQVINWGESTFIQNGMNVINPVDLARLRTAGAEVREALLPLPMVRADVIVDDQISMMGFWNFVWRETRLDPKGTFFSTNDFVSPDGAWLIAAANAAVPDTAVAGGVPAPGTFVPRVGDNDGSAAKNFGGVFRYYSPELNDTEFQLFFAWHSSRLPLISANKGFDIAVPVGPSTPTGSTPIFTTNYLIEYPDDIKLIGASFNTMFGTVAVQGEYSFHWDQPIQLDLVSLANAILAPQNFGPVLPNTPFPNFAEGSFVQGWRRKCYSQLQATGTHSLGPTGPADDVAIVYEGGMTFIHGLKSKAVEPTQATGFGDSYAAGYRVLGRATFNNVFSSTTLTPSIAFSHDLFGRIPAPLSTFTKDVMRITASLNARYLSFQTTLSYTTSFNGGAGNTLIDRDFVSLNASYSY